jgi:hypothetical protein
MATDTVTIEQFVADNGITITSAPVDRNPNMEGSADMDNYKVTLSRPTESGWGAIRAFDVYLNGKCIETVFRKDSDKPEDIKLSLVNHDGYDPEITVLKRRVPRSVKMTVYFSKGTGHHGAEPTVEEVLDCLSSDAAGIENASNFEDWCSEYGYDTDSRSAEKTFKACEHSAKRLRNFLGDDLYDQLLWHTEKL